MNFPWQALEDFPSQRAVPFLWRERLGDACYELFAGPFLDRETDPVLVYPCRRCGCLHEVLPLLHGGPHLPGSTVEAACVCDPWSCDTMTLNFDDLLPLRLNWPRLARTLCRALNLNSQFACLKLAKTFQIGSWSTDGVPVIVTVPWAADALRNTICELMARLGKPFILFGPTSRHLDTHCIELLEKAGAEFFSLAGTIILTHNATLQCAKTPGDLFAKFTPQPKETDVSVAEHAFALIKALDPACKPPLPLTIFRHYCIDNLSMNEIALRCRCSKGTVLNRIDLIREKTGIDLETFRQVSGHLDKVEDATTDARASHIHRKNLIDDSHSESSEA